MVCVLHLKCTYESFICFSYIFTSAYCMQHLNLFEGGYIHAPHFNLLLTHSRIKHLAVQRYSFTMMAVAAWLSAFPPEVHRAQETLSFHIVQTLRPVLFSQQINRSGVELEPCSTLTSKHHNLFMRLLLDCKMFCAPCGWSLHRFSFLIN